MKRNILLAILVAAATATVSLAGAPAAWATVECRYVIQPGPGLDLVPVPPPPPGTPPNQVIYVSGVTRYVPYIAPYIAVQPRWSVVGLRSAPGTNYNLALRDCDWDMRAVSTLSTELVDFIAVDGNQPMPGRMSAKVTNATDVVGTFALEYSTGAALDAGASETLLIRGTPALVRDVYVAGGETAVVSLSLTSGDADLAVITSTSDSWLKPRVQAVQTSSQPGLTEDRVAITVPPGSPGQIFGVVVVNNAALTQATLRRF